MLVNQRKNNYDPQLDQQLLWTLFHTPLKLVFNYHKLVFLVKLLKTLLSMYMLTLQTSDKQQIKASSTEYSFKNIYC